MKKEVPKKTPLYHYYYSTPLGGVSIIMKGGEVIRVWGNKMAQAYVICLLEEVLRQYDVYEKGKNQPN